MAVSVSRPAPCGARDVLTVILIPAGLYLPGYRGGGPIRSIANLVEQLGQEYEFRVIAWDRDLGAEVPYPDVEVGRWMRRGKASVLYVRPGLSGIEALRRVMRATAYDILYLNSFFDPVTALLPLLWRRLRIIPWTPCAVAPRGQFSPGALELKPARKRLYSAVTRAIGLWNDVVFHSTSPEESMDIRRMLGGSVLQRVVEARNVSSPAGGVVGRAIPKRPGELRVVFLSRISRKKNLKGAIQLLQGAPGRVVFDIYGPIEDAAYWQECVAVAASVSPRINVRYRGELDHAQVAPLLTTYDLFLLPTLGENHGHAIAEALAVGCPVLISDRTPWRNLAAARAGWDLPLEEPARFAEAISQMVALDEIGHQSLREGARRLATVLAGDTDAVEAHRTLFYRLSERSRTS